MKNTINKLKTKLYIFFRKIYVGIFKLDSILCIFLAYYFLPYLKGLWMGILNNSLKDSLNAEILTALSFIIALIFFRILTTLITDIFDLYRSKKKKIDFEKLDKINYIIISDENLAQWAIINGLYDKVPGHLWIELKAAQDKCLYKNYNVILSLDIIKLRNDNFKNLIELKSKIINLLLKK
jgi:hypothetical protein